jgi:hypothetical protein
MEGGRRRLSPHKNNTRPRSAVMEEIVILDAGVELADIAASMSCCSGRPSSTAAVEEG